MASDEKSEVTSINIELSQVRTFNLRLGTEEAVKEPSKPLSFLL